MKRTLSHSSGIYAPLEKGGILFCNCRSVGLYVSLSVCRPSLVQSISFDPFTWSILNLVQGLPSMSRWSLLIFRSHVQRSRSNYSSKPSVLSGQYLLTPSLDQYHTKCRGCNKWVDDDYWFSGHMFKGQGQTTLLSPLSCPLNIFWPLYLINTNLVQGLPLMSRWPLLISRSHAERSRSNHSSQPTLLSAQYLLTPSIGQYQTWCRGCP